MKHTLSIIIALLFAPIIAVQADDLTRSISIVPTPVQMVPGEGELPIFGSDGVCCRKFGTGGSCQEFY